MKTYSLFLGAALVMALTSCSQNDGVCHLDEKKSEVRFTSNIITMSPATRAAGNTWDGNDKIGVYMLEKESTSVVNEMSNVQHITETGGSAGSFKAVDEIIYFPDNGKEVRFMAYYPYKSDVIGDGDIYKVDVTNQNSQAKIDLLYSFKTDAVFEKTVSEKVVPLEFNHMLTKLIVNIKAGEGLESSDLAGIKIHFEGLNSTADFNLFSGSLSNHAGSANIVPLSGIAPGGYVANFESILIPTDAVPNARIVFDLNNAHEDISSDVFMWSFDKELVKSTKHTYNVTINRTGIEVKATIIDWLNGGEDSIIAE